MSYDIYLPDYSIGPDVFAQIDRICRPYGTKAVAVGGKTAFSVVKEKMLKALSDTDASVTVLNFLWYGGEASYENVARLQEHPAVKEADMIFAIGGGKATDTAKALGFVLQKPVFTFPTIASNCSACTSVSIMYRPDGTFYKPFFFEKPPAHAFIDTEIIASSPKRYLWAGLGDTYAKYFESFISSRDEETPHYVALGVAASRMCYQPIMKYGEAALREMEQGLCAAGPELEQAVLSVIVSTAVASILLTTDHIIDYNTGLAHAIFYALTSFPQIEKNHLHGEVVAYGVLVLLLVDRNEEDFKRVYEFNRSVGLPVRLSDIEIDGSDLEKVADMAAQMKDIEHNPYPIDRTMIAEAMKELERRGADL